jgi:uncharacterized protein
MLIARFASRRESTSWRSISARWLLVACALTGLLCPLSATAQPAANGAAAAVPNGAPAGRIVLLLPARASRFGDAGEAIRRGFLAARQVAGDSTPVDVIETDESSAQLLAALASVHERGADVVVGPLTRDAVNVLADAKRDDMPAVTLNFPDRETLPPSLLAFGFSIEQEARQIARTALGANEDAASPPLAPGPAQRLLIVGGRGALDRRMAAAFRRALIELGQEPEVEEPSFDAGGLNEFSARQKDRAYDSVFLALGAREATQVRPRLTKVQKFWATSQVNPGGVMAEALAGQLAGVRFADMPWLIEPEQPKVASYPRLRAESGTPPPSVESERLYALGIDAYRVAKIWSTGSTQFELAGVTGHLQVDRSRSARVERFPVFAVFRGGRIQREQPAP